MTTFVTNLDRMHFAVGTAMPKAQLPSFSLRSISEGRLEVEYRSERTGLEKFVLGLFYGLMERFNVTGSVQVMDSSGDATILEIIYTAGA